MCDDDTVRENQQHFKLSRRQLARVGASAALMAVLPARADAQAVTGTDVSVTTPDGKADCYYVHPQTGTHAGIIIWPDVLGLRPAFRAMAKRLAESGYAVLVVNPYYRDQKSPVVQPGESFQDEGTRNKVLPLARNLSFETNVTDTKAFVAFLDAQVEVDTSRPIGTTGYCMGGPITMRAAAAVPERIGAGASFHGGGLVTDDPRSPHKLVPEMRAQFLFAIADNDDEREPDAKHALRKAFDEANLFAEIEVYEGALHGWCPPDSRVYDAALAERAWSRMLALFDRALQPAALKPGETL